MLLFERLLYLHQSPESLAADFAERLRWDGDADPAEIYTELAAIINARNTWAADLETLERERASKATPWDDMGGTPTAAQLETYRQQRTAADAEAQETAARIADNITALDTLFRALCNALDFHGLNLTGGKISRLVGLGLPEHLAADLNTIHKEHRATIPEAERLTLEDATALYNGLAKEGLISGPLEAFIYHFGKLYGERAKRPNTGLSWLGTSAQFVFFAWRLSMYMQPGPYGYTQHRKAICAAFPGIDERQRRNTLDKEFSAFHGGARKSCKGSKQIAQIFEALPGINNANI